MLNDQALDQLFRKARTNNAWLDKPAGAAKGKSGFVRPWRRTLS